mmetsp:Transcript_16094/g.19699  ORF Transcript_16094/g.19699 Transcript_16094/m.19699 type:complete len:95 (+) Transcript_16094:34-318(+)
MSSMQRLRPTHEAVVEAKLDIYVALCEIQNGASADQRWAAYLEAVGLYIVRRLSKSELEVAVTQTLGYENVRKHNTLLLALLADVRINFFNLIV